jgi:hypothetical protein
MEPGSPFRRSPSETPCKFCQCPGNPQNPKWFPADENGRVSKPLVHVRPNRLGLQYLRPEVLTAGAGTARCAVASASCAKMASYLSLNFWAHWVQYLSADPKGRKRVEPKGREGTLNLSTDSEGSKSEWHLSSPAIRRPRRVKKQMESVIPSGPMPRAPRGPLLLRECARCWAHDDTDHCRFF